MIPDMINMTEDIITIITQDKEIIWILRRADTSHLHQTENHSEVAAREEEIAIVGETIAEALLVDQNLPATWPQMIVIAIALMKARGGKYC